MKFTLGFSPCPNDTFIFDALVNQKIDTEGITFDFVLEDVETLNQWASLGKLDITKLSFFSFFNNLNHYHLLQSGSALGNGVGPLVVCSKEKFDSIKNINEWVNAAQIAIPGYQTTANLLFSLAFPNALNKKEIIFNEIENKVLQNEFDIGVVIHESRFTYQERGLEKIVDLGDWWQTEMNQMIPLGGIAIQRKLGKEWAEKIDLLLQKSIEYAWKNYPQLSNFVTAHAQEMEAQIMRKHIELYVNQYSQNLGLEGRSAINTLFRKTQEIGIVSSAFNIDSLFY